MAIRSTAGTTIAISSAAPASFTEAGYAALTYSVIGEVTNLGEFTRTYNLIKHNPIGTRGTRKLKGSFDEGSTTLAFARDSDDAGQIIAKTAALSDEDYSFVITAQGGDKFYFQAKVMTRPIAFGGVDDIQSGSLMLEITTSNTGVGVIEVTAP